MSSGARRLPRCALVCFSLATAGSVAPPTYAGEREAIATAPPPSSDRRPSREGLVVVGSVRDVQSTWSLAQGIYASPALRPRTLDERSARVLAGEDPTQGAASSDHELAEFRSGVTGDNAPSRLVLASIAKRFGSRGVIFVQCQPACVARILSADSEQFDAALYPQPKEGWSKAIASVEASWGTRAVAANPAISPTTRTERTGSPTVAGPAAPRRAPSTALMTDPAALTPTDTSRGGRGTVFYRSPWFWGAIGAAAFVGAGAFFLTRDNSSETIHLQMRTGS